MRFSHLLATGALVVLSGSSYGYTHSRRGPTSQHSLTKHPVRTVPHAVGQHSIDDGRAAEIQQALAHVGYLSGEPTGRWDGTTEAAMQRYQADHGWQTKIIPDSRAIIKLGLGPQGGESSTSIAATALPR